jgi:hypothetical protein
VSADWDLRCVDCGVDAGLFNATNAESRLWALIDSADLLAEFDAHPGNRGWFEVMDLGRSWLDASPVEFVVAHRAHQMVPHSHGQVLQGPNRRLIDGRRLTQTHELVDGTGYGDERCRVCGLWLWEIFHLAFAGGSVCTPGGADAYRSGVLAPPGSRLP